LVQFAGGDQHRQNEFDLKRVDVEVDESFDGGLGDGEEHGAVVGEAGCVEPGDVVAVDPVELQQDSLVLD
jgi:hypothetical protein